MAWSGNIQKKKIMVGTKSAKEKKKTSKTCKNDTKGFPCAFNIILELCHTGLPNNYLIMVGWCTVIWLVIFHWLEHRLCEVKG